MAEIPSDREHDPREQEEWFVRLPPEAREELRGKWRRFDRVDRDHRRRRRGTTLAWMAEAWLVYWLMAWFAWSALPVVLAAGALVGLAGSRLRAGPMIHGALGGAGCLAVLLFSGALTAWSLFGLAATTYLFALLAHAHRLQRFDGTEA